MPEFGDLQQRIAALTERISSGPADEALLDAMEEILSEGYIRALAGDAEQRRLDERLEQLMLAPGDVDVIADARRLAQERQAIDTKTRTLRAELAVIRRRLIELRRS
jgi:hypothetical protein